MGWAAAKERFFSEQQCAQKESSKYQSMPHVHLQQSPRLSCTVRKAVEIASVEKPATNKGNECTAPRNTHWYEDKSKCEVTQQKVATTHFPSVPRPASATRRADAKLSDARGEKGDDYT